MAVVIKKYSDGFVVRTAEREDKEACLKISVYDGLDYVAHMYDHYMDNPNYHCYLGELNGEVLTFGYGYVVDDGCAVIKGAGRSASSARGKGYQARFQKESDQYFHSLFPRIHLVKYTAFLGDYQRKFLKTLEKDGRLKTLVIRNLHCFKTNMEALLERLNSLELKSICDELKTKEAVQAPKGIIPHQLLDESNRTVLFPKDIVTVFWENYNVLPSNLQYIMDTSTCHLTFADPRNKVKVSAVSFITEVPCAAGLRYDIEAYTDTSLPVETQTQLLLQHFVKSLLSLSHRAEYSKEMEVSPILYFPLAVDSAVIKQWVLDHFPGSTSGAWPATQYVAVTGHKYQQVQSSL